MVAERPRRWRRITFFLPLPLYHRGHTFLLNVSILVTVLERLKAHVPIPRNVRRGRRSGSHKRPIGRRFPRRDRSPSTPRPSKGRPSHTAEAEGHSSARF